MSILTQRQLIYKRLMQIRIERGNEAALKELIDLIVTLDERLTQLENL